MITGAKPYALPPEVVAENAVADRIGRSLNSGTPMEPLVGARRVEEALRDGEPLWRIEDELDAEENWGRDG